MSTYQSVRTKIETPIWTNYSSLSPAIPFYSDNFEDALSDAEDEFVHVNIQFGLTTEATLTTSLDQVRGILVIRVFTQKGQGSRRNQTLITSGSSAILGLNQEGKPSSGVYVRTGSVEGPTFSTEGPYFVSRIETAFEATVIS